ncbi:hypothetical protein DSO57_1002059 [Entomophthora muscae]|uniref:Uncharacterized protein n=1 Tax=Entomophthora muscae TaxID=34485 RepID=A0ACC2RZZ9_9FUNG|nr:hypothetical protein DSO57_1002059 [Entomophthora muscae]
MSTSNEKKVPSLNSSCEDIPNTAAAVVNEKPLSGLPKESFLTPSKEVDTKAKVSKSKPKLPTLFKNMGCKGIFSVLFCVSDAEKSKSREKDAASVRAPSLIQAPQPPAPTTTQPIVPVEEVPEKQPSTKPSLEDLIYSASPDATTRPSPSLTPEPIVREESSVVLPNKKHLLPSISEEHQGRKCLVLDLDETLVHSSFKLIDHPDFIVPVEIDNQIHNVYVAKRPGVDEFLKKVGEIYEVVVFTASLSKYADPVLDMLDIHKVVKHRLFRESCYNHNGNYVKDLSQLGRDLRHAIIIDNSPTSYIFHPANAVPITTWFNDLHDTELLDLIPFLTDLSNVDDVTKVLDNSVDELA